MVKCQNAGMKATWVMTDEEKQEKKEAALAKKRLKEISGNFRVSNFSAKHFFFQSYFTFFYFQVEFVQLGLDTLRM